MHVLYASYQYIIIDILASEHALMCMLRDSFIYLFILLVKVNNLLLL